MKCEKSGNHTISYQSLLLSTTVLNDSKTSKPTGIYTICNPKALAVVPKQSKVTTKSLRVINSVVPVGFEV